ncbi:MAG: acyl-CoA dehydrogenase family protein, partial [Desulfosudaceae bacterium]
MSQQFAAHSCQEYFNREHQMLRQALREFVKKEMTPFVEEWEAAGTFPRELYKKVADLGFLGIGFPESIGGSGGDVFSTIVFNEEMMRCGAAGVVASLGSHGIGLPPIALKGTPEQIDKFVKPVLAGDRVA